MIRNVLIVSVLGFFLLAGTTDSHAVSWTKNDVDIPNKSVDSNYYDADSVKVLNKTLQWTEKFVLTNFGEKNYTKHLSQYPVCQQNIAKKGNVTHHQLDLEIKGGKYRTVAKRNYNKADELICTDKDMGTEFSKSWEEITYQSPMYFRHYELATKYKIGDL